MFTLKKTRIFN